MKVEIITPSETRLVGEFDSLPIIAELKAAIPDFETWFYSEDQGVVVAHAHEGPYMLISLPPGGPREDGLYWDGPYKDVGEITDMWT